VGVGVEGALAGAVRVAVAAAWGKEVGGVVVEVLGGGVVGKV
jgi:hypothetical protein